VHTAILNNEWGNFTTFCSDKATVETMRVCLSDSFSSAA
jgi:hypothetical protein